MWFGKCHKKSPVSFLVTANSCKEEEASEERQMLASWVHSLNDNQRSIDHYFSQRGKVEGAQKS